MRYDSPVYFLATSGAHNMYEALQITCQLYADNEMDSRNFSYAVFNLFADDSQMDWCDDIRSLQRFAAAILAG